MTPTWLLIQEASRRAKRSHEAWALAADGFARSGDFRKQSRADSRAHYAREAQLALERYARQLQSANVGM